MHRAVIIGMTLLISACLVACGASGGSTASPTPEPTAGASPSAASESALPSIQSSVPELEDLLPDTVGPMTLFTASWLGSEVLADEDFFPPAPQRFIEDRGAAPDDVALAIGGGQDEGTGTDLRVEVFRVQGMDADVLIPAYKAAFDSERLTPLVWEAVTIGDKQVEHAPDPEAHQIVYLYPADDLLFFVATNREDLIAELFEGLP